MSRLDEDNYDDEYDFVGDEGYEDEMDQCTCGEPKGVNDEECDTCAWEEEQKYRDDVLAQVEGY